MSLKAYRKGIEEIQARISNMSDEELVYKLKAMGFREVPSHFIAYLREF